MVISTLGWTSALPFDHESSLFTRPESRMSSSKHLICSIASIGALEAKPSALEGGSGHPSESTWSSDRGRSPMRHAAVKTGLK